MATNPIGLYVYVGIANIRPENGPTQPRGKLSSPSRQLYVYLFIKLKVLLEKPKIRTRPKRV